MTEFIDFLLREWVISATLLVLIILLISNIVMDATKKYSDITTTEAVNLMDDDNVVLLDVREAKERTGGYIKGDIHIPMAQVKNKLNTLPQQKKIIVYCRSGNRSTHICSTLTRNGFEQVYNLKGGITAWQKANLPINTK